MKVLIIELMKILKDKSLSNQHENVLQSINIMFRAMSEKMKSYLNMIYPELIEYGKTCDNSNKPILFQIFRNLFTFSPIISRSFIPQFFKMFLDFENYGVIDCLLCIIEVSSTLYYDLSPYCNKIIQNIIEFVENDKSPKKSVACNILKTSLPLFKRLYNYNSVILTSLLYYIEQNLLSLPTEFILCCLDGISLLAELPRISGEALHLIQVLLLLIEKIDSNEIYDKVMNIFCDLVYSLKYRYYIFINTVDRILKSKNIFNKKYNDLVEMV